MVKTTDCSILVCGKCLSVSQSPPHFPSIIIPFHSSTMSCVRSISYFSKLTSSPHPNALRLAPPQSSRLLVTVKQCANQLAHNSGVYALERVRPNSLCSGAGALLPCSWRSLKEKRCTKLTKFKLMNKLTNKLTNVKLNQPKLSNVKPTQSETRGDYEQGHPRHEDFHEQRVQSEFKFSNSKLSSLKVCKSKSRNVHAHFPECNDNVFSSYSMHSIQPRSKNNLRNKRMSQKRRSKQQVLRKLQSKGQTCCSRNQVLDCVVEFQKVERKKSKPNRNKMRRKERKQLYSRKKNGKVVEVRASKEGQRRHNKAYKAVWKHTKRILNDIVYRVEHDKCNVKQKIGGRRMHNNSLRRKQSKENKGSKTKAVSAVSQAQMSKEKSGYLGHSVIDVRTCCFCNAVDSQSKRIAQCDKCNMCCHVQCLQIPNIEHILANRSVSWICCQCGTCNYSECLLYDFGIPTDKNMFIELSEDKETSAATERIHDIACSSEHKAEESRVYTSKGEVQCKRKRRTCTSCENQCSLQSKKCAKFVSYKLQPRKNKSQQSSEAVGDKIHIAQHNTQTTTNVHCKEHSEKGGLMMERKDKTSQVNCRSRAMKNMTNVGNASQINTENECVANSLCAILYSRIKTLNTWSCNDVESVLNTGKGLCSYLSSSSISRNGNLNISELPDELNVYNEQFNMIYHDPVFATCEERDLCNFSMTALSTALEQTLQKYPACCICLSGNTFSVIAQCGVYFIFDSHCRNGNGWQESEGRSVVKSVTSWQGVLKYCSELKMSMGLSDNVQFAIFGVNAWTDDNVSLCNQNENTSMTSTTEQIACKEIPQLNGKEVYKENTLTRKGDNDGLLGETVQPFTQCMCNFACETDRTMGPNNCVCLHQQTGGYSLRSKTTKSKKELSEDKDKSEVHKMGADCGKKREQEKGQNVQYCLRSRKTCSDALDKSKNCRELPKRKAKVTAKNDSVNIKKRKIVPEKEIESALKCDMGIGTCSFEGTSCAYSPHEEKVNNMRIMVQGNFHQGDYRFGNSSGKQCVANSLCAILYSTVKKLNMWHSNDLDFVLNSGNELYVFLSRSSTVMHEYLLVSELPDQIDVFSKHFNIKSHEPVMGTFEDDRNLANFNMMSLSNALEQMLQKYIACFVCFYENTFAVISQDGMYYIFDSHSRNKNGHQDGEGQSLLKCVSSWQGVYRYCSELAKSMNLRDSEQFEVTGVSVWTDDISNSCISNVDNSQTGSDALTRSDMQNTEDDDDDDDITIVGYKQSVDLKFVPLTSATKIALCNKFKICQINISSDDISINCERLGRPDHVKNIQGDGNCFFRAVSYAISGTVCNHMQLRTMTVFHLLENAPQFQGYLREGYMTVEDYVTRSEMFDNGTWATEVEIMAMADMLGVNIYTYDDENKWYIVSGLLCSSDALADTGIYLYHRDRVHYDFVLSVQDLIANEPSNCTEETSLQSTKVEVPVTRMSCKRRKRPNLRLKRKLEREKKREKYQKAKDVGIKEVRASCAKSKYHWDEIHRANKVSTAKNKYQENAGLRERKLNTTKTKYHQDKKHKARKISTAKTKYQQDEKHRERKISTAKTKYQQDEALRERMITTAKNRYVTDSKYKIKKLKNEKRKYVDDVVYRQRKMNSAKSKYHNNVIYRNALIKSIKRKYHNSVNYRNALITSMKRKYHNNVNYRNALIKSMKRKYHNNVNYRNALITSMKRKYLCNHLYKRKLVTFQKMKYRCDVDYRTKMKQRNLNRQKKKKKTCRIMNNVMMNWRREISNGPEYVCAVCLKLLFKKQVIRCKREKYSITDCISTMYLCSCFCREKCTYECLASKCSRSVLWICYTCHRKLLQRKTPQEACTNNLKVVDIPEELSCLNALEEHLISINLPFMKMIALPRGGQNAVHGPVVCVPSNITETVTTLPRCRNADQLVRVKLKRKLSYKGYYQYQFVNRQHVQNALCYLKKNNLWYKDIEMNCNWTDPLENDNEDEVESTSGQESEEESNESDEETDDDRLRGMPLDTCLQPVDIGQEVLDQYFDDVLCVAPCEGNSPVRVLMEEGSEAKCFPALFPTGKCTYHDERNMRLTLSRYFHNRLMHVDNRFARNTQYIFYAQYLSEIEKVMSSVSIAMRQSSSKVHCRKNFNANMIKDRQQLKNILQSDSGYKFLKPIRGTPPFWQSAQRDVMAMIRQLGIPTWFCSFSAADLRWPEVINTILKQQGDKRNIEDLDWNEKCIVLRSNPVTVARMFDKRFHTFLKDVIMSKAEPIGKVKDYFYRVEFQHRGSPHTHCLFWIENAPRQGVDSDSEVIEFIYQYISCKLPSVEEDEELNEIISHVQRHSKKHSKSCRKKGTECRFNFPRPPSTQTFITEPQPTDHADADESTESDDKKEHDEAKELLKSVWSAIQDEKNQYMSTSELFESINITQVDFEKANNVLSRKCSIILKREPQDVWVNQYNPDLIRCWNANMDIQYISDPYSCAAYVVSYMSKSEREMGHLLSQAQREVQKGNLDARQSMKEIGSVYLHNREISAQEAVFRVCSLRLKEGSRKVEFIPVGENPVRMSLPLSVIQGKSEDDEDIFMASKIDRYKARPDIDEFQDMCLATFCSEYRIIYGASTFPKSRFSPVYTLKNGLGHIQKRTRTDPAVIRYPRFSVSQHPEKYYHIMLQLFLPYRVDAQLKPPQFETYEQFYTNGAVCLNGQLQSVNVVVQSNRSKYETNIDDLEAAQKYVEKFGMQEDAWALICPVSEQERIECEANRQPVTEEENEFDIPDLQLEHQNDKTYNIEPHSMKISKQDAMCLLRSLNVEQRRVFNRFRDWCLQKLNGNIVESFHVFVTGGAGTGKSHFIKSVYYEATRLFARTLQNPDNVSVLITAPTGVAAFNINGSTIHSALSIPIDARLPYIPLGDEKLNTLRNSLQDLQIMIIDEISMVDHKILCYIHGRLRQIKQTRDQKMFGNISILAVGDFYQLPPVKGKALYQRSVTVDLWNDYFEKVELKEIMRQKEDTQFAEMLNRLRVRTKQKKILDEDVATLRSRETGEDWDDALHIFPCNKEVNEYNMKTLFAKCSDCTSIVANDFQRNSGKSKKTIQVKKTKKSLHSTLPDLLWLGIGARVMLTKNIDVSDGLVNGVLGTVCEIIMLSDKPEPKCIQIEFDNKNVGSKRKKKCLSSDKLIIAIEKEEENVSKEIVRRQFPLKLAWACTVHKVQGLTTQKAVVCLQRTFAAGQAYVALSRVTSLNGLVIQDFDEKFVYCNGSIAESLTTMQNFIDSEVDIRKPLSNEMVIMLHNIQGLKEHYLDLSCNNDMMGADFICLTETWLDDRVPHDTELTDFKSYHQIRSLSYDNISNVTERLKQQCHGGVAVYGKRKWSLSRLDIGVQNLEYIALQVICELSYSVVIIYRPPSYSVNEFIVNMKFLLNELHKVSNKCIVMGDFNEDILKHSSQIEKLMHSHGYRQCVTEPTTENGTLIDHVYVRNMGSLDVVVNVVPTYYSYHEAVRIAIGRNHVS